MELLAVIVIIAFAYYVFQAKRYLKEAKKQIDKSNVIDLDSVRK